MPRFRLAIITRRYWPLVGGSERVIGYLAEELQRRDVSSTIITAQWEPHWPRETNQLAVPVVRLAHPQVRTWGTLRYLWDLSRWLRTHRSEFDAVLVSSLKEDAYATLATLPPQSGKHKLPVILRVEKAGPAGDCAWHETANFGKRIRSRCQQASAIIASTDAASEELIAAGFAADRIEQIANGVPVTSPRTLESRQAARASLGQIHGDLSTEPTTPVAVYVGHLLKEKGLHDLIRAWRKIVEIWPDARLWLVGEGPERSDLYHRIRDCNLQYHIFMPGAFDDVGEFLQAADVFISPTHEEGTSVALLEAMAAELPVIATNLAEQSRLIGNNECGWLVPKRNAIELAEAIARVFTLRDVAATLAMNARQRILQQHSVSRMAEQHIELIDQLLAKGELS